MEKTPATQNRFSPPPGIGLQSLVAGAPRHESAARSALPVFDIAPPLGYK
jgi:hypothetical protein